MWSVNFHRHLQHVLAEERHPSRAVGLLEVPAGGQGRRTVEDPDVVEAEEAPLEDVLAEAVLAVHPPGEVPEELAEGVLQKSDVALPAPGLLQPVEEERGPGVHGRVHVAEVPFVGGDLAGGVQVRLVQHEVELLLGEVHVDRREGDRVESEVPGGVPRVLPLVGHGNHVVVDHVAPLPVARGTGRDGEGVDPVLLQPPVGVEEVVLLGPQHAGDGLPHHQHLVLRRLGGSDGMEELVRIPLALFDHVVESREGAFRSGDVREPKAQHRRPPRVHLEPMVGRRLGPDALGVHRLPASLDDAVVDAVLDVGPGIRSAEQPLIVGLVLGEEERHLPLHVQPALSELGVGGRDHPGALSPVDLPKCRPGRIGPPRPRVAEPERGQNVERCRLRATVGHRDPDEDILGRGLGVLDEDVEVAVVREDAGVEQLVLQLLARPMAVRHHEVVVRVGPLRVLVEPLHVGVSGCRVEVEVVLLDVLAVVALGVGQAEGALLQDRVLPVPQGEGEAEPLLVVGKPGQPIFAPVVGAGACLVVAEVAPGVPVVAVVLADGAPLPLAQVGTPLPPGDAFVAGIRQPLELGNSVAVRHGVLLLDHWSFRPPTAGDGPGC
jgi:hypothetical protein